MFASKPAVSSSNPSSLHLPTMSKSNRSRHQRSPTLSHTSMASATISTSTSENVSALKAKYIDYAMWLKASSRQNREPIFTHELLKHSLCQMGIDTTQAEQLVSTCSWYVYQFQKQLEVANEGHDITLTAENKMTQRSSKQCNKKMRKNKSKKRMPPREHSSESATTVTSINKENIVSSPATPSIHSKFSVLPAIQPSAPMTSPRSRHVDFNNEPLPSQTLEKQKSSHWRSSLLKTRTLPKLRLLETELNTYNHIDITPETTPIDLDLSNSQKAFHQNVLPGAHQTRSILRKNIGSSSSIISTEVDNRSKRNSIFRPSSISNNEIPLGTKSQRLFGGSEFFAQIMNELEQQELE